MFWIFCAAIVVIVASAILAPVLRARPASAQPAAAFDLRIYRDQLREVDRDLERGVITADDAVRLRTEIGRKILDADKRMSQATTSQAGDMRGIAAAVLLVLFAGAIALYLREGVPGNDDLPIARRIAEAERIYDARPSQAQAEARAPQRPGIEVDEETAALIQRLRDVVTQRPEDPQGLALLATNEMRLGNIAAAREAQQRLVDVRGDTATADELTRLSALMVESAGGLVTPEAEQVMTQALKLNPLHPQARYLLGLLQLQNDRPDRAFVVWRKLLEEGPADAPWLMPIRASILDLAWMAGQQGYVPPQPATALSGPDADALAAAEDMSEEERQQMVEGMVARLEARLAEQGGTPEEWARLISSLILIGKVDHARDILSEAQTRFAAAPEALALVNRSAAAAGLTE